MILRAALALVMVLAADSGAPDPSTCIASWPEARYGALGYNHIVHVRNACAPAADCAVSTNVNPEIARGVVPGRSEVEVMTFLGSPATAFTPRVSCVMRTR